MKNTDERLQLKAVKHYPSMSEETTCFEGKLYLDGKLLGRVVNHGTGGEHEFCFSWDKVKLLEEYAKTQPMYCWSDGTEFITIEDGQSTTSKWSHQDAEMVVNNLLEDWLDKDSMKKALRKGVVLMHKDEPSKYSTISFRDYPILRRQPLDIRNAKWFDDNKYTILNTLSPRDQIDTWTKGNNDDLFRYKVLKESA